VKENDFSTITPHCRRLAVSVGGEGRQARHQRRTIVRVGRAGATTNDHAIDNHGGGKPLTSLSRQYGSSEITNNEKQYDKVNRTQRITCANGFSLARFLRITRVNTVRARRTRK